MKPKFALYTLCFLTGLIIMRVKKGNIYRELTEEKNMNAKGGKYSIFDIAAWFLNKESMTHKRIQKLCYYAFAWDQAIGNGNLIKNCEFEAWVHGPVNDDLYQCLKGNFVKELTEKDLIGDRCSRSISKITDPDDVEFLESVWETYGEFGANALEIMTHNELPWIKARGTCGAFDRCNTIISPDDMRDYYRSIYIGTDESNA